MLTREFSVDSILRTDQVPTLPEVAIQILRVAQQPESDKDELCRVIQADPAIAGRVVRFAGSPLFGFRRDVVTIESAVVLLGTTMIRTLVLGFTLAQQGPSQKSLREHFRQIWRETLFQAATAELLGERHAGVDPAVWSLAALLQDAGRLVMLNVFGEEYVRQVINGDDGISLSDRERDAFGFTHSEVSAALCRSWNLGDDVFRAVLMHHSVNGNATDGTPTLEQAMRTASICNQYMEAVSRQPRSARASVERELIQVHRCRPDEVIELLAEVDCHARGLAAAFDADVGDMPSREMLLQKAQTILFDIAIREQLRRLDRTSAVALTDEPETPVDSRWLDSDTGAFTPDSLEQILPRELKQSAEGTTALGVLAVDVPAAGQVPVSDTDTQQSVVQMLQSCVRPGDSIISQSDGTWLVVLPEMSMDVLAGVAARIRDCAAADRQESDAIPSIGGLMIVPAGSGATSFDCVLDAVTSSLGDSRSSGKNEFLVLQGNKCTSVHV